MATPPAVPDQTLTGLGALMGGFVVAVIWIVKNFFAGKTEGSNSESHGKHVILEQAELRDFGDLPKQMSLIATKMEQVFAQSTDNGEEIGRLNRDIQEQLRILRKLEGELEVAKRLREENLLARRSTGH